MCKGRRLFRSLTFPGPGYRREVLSLTGYLPIISADLLYENGPERFMNILLMISCRGDHPASQCLPVIIYSQYGRSEILYAGWQ